MKDNTQDLQQKTKSRALLLVVITISVIALIGTVVVAEGVNPFTGVSMKMANPTSNTSTDNQKIQATAMPVLATPEQEDSFMKTLSWTMKFGARNITFSRMGSGVIQDTWWQSKITRTVTNTETIDSIFSQFPDVYDGLVYHTGKGEYYVIYPSAYEKISVASASQFEQERKPILRKTPVASGEVGMSIYRSGEFVLPYTGGQTQWRAVKQEKFHVFDVADATNESKWYTDGYVIVCYLPIEGTSDYVRFDMPLASAGSESDMCDEISKMGIQSAKE